MRIRNFGDFDKLNEDNQGGGNKFILVRFGNSIMPTVSKYFAEMASKSPKPIAMRIPGAIVTMFETSSTKEAIIQGFDRLGITYNLYQIVHTSGGSTGPELVARKPNKEQLKAKLAKAIEDERWEDAATLRDQIAELEGRPTPVGGNESQVVSFGDFQLLEKEEEFVNGTNTEEFNILVSKLVDHELEELEDEKEKGISKDDCQKIKDYLVQNNYYVAPEKKEDDKKEGEE